MGTMGDEMACGMSHFMSHLPNMAPSLSMHIFCIRLWPVIIELNLGERVLMI